MTIASLCDREKLVNEIEYKDDYFAEINQERRFLEIVFYLGDPSSIRFPFDEFQEMLEVAKIHLIEDSFERLSKKRKAFMASMNENFVNQCEILNEETKIKILHNNVLLAEIDQVSQPCEIAFYYHGKNIEMALEGLQQILQEVKVLLTMK